MSLLCEELLLLFGSLLPWRYTGISGTGSWLNLMHLFSISFSMLFLGLHVHSHNLIVIFLLSPIDRTKYQVYICKVSHRSLGTCTTIGKTTSFLVWGVSTNKFHLQILPLQRCGHDGAHVCTVCWSFGKARTSFADSRAVFMCVYNVEENRKTRRMWNAVCDPFLECKKHEPDWHFIISFVRCM
jgi:hypothetical protein